MTDITLSDYAGFILLEMVKAREMADAYSRAVAERYAADEVLRHFPAPRFKIPKMDLTIPVLVSGARFKQTMRFDFPVSDFVSFVAARANAVRVTVALAQGGLQHGPILPRPGPEQGSPALRGLAREFHDQLRLNADPRHPEAIVAVMWSRVFRQCLAEARLLKAYAEKDPKHELLDRTTAEVLAAVRQRTAVDRTEIESLLVDPETNVVKNGGSETSVFTVKAELQEEGVYFRSVVDGESQQEHVVVEFD